MGVKVSDLLQETTHVDLQVGGSAVGLEARVFPQPMSDQERERITELPVRDFYAELLARMLVGWDLVDDKGKPVPVTPTAIERAKLPAKFLQMAHDAVVARRREGKDGASSSPAGSPPVEP